MASNPQDVQRRARLEQALRAASQQGDERAARMLAQELRAMRPAEASEPSSLQQRLVEGGREAGRNVGGLQGALINIGAGIPGVRAASAGLLGLTQGVPAEDARTFIDAAVEGVRGRDPLAASIGNVTGGLLAGAAAGAGVQAGLRGLSAARVAPEAVRRTAAALRFQPGQTGLNVARAIPEGAAFGAGAAALEGEDTLSGAGSGALGGVVGVGVSGAVGAGADTVRRLAGTREGGASLLRNLVDVSPQELRRRAEEFFRLRGRGPRLTEIVSPEEGGRRIGAVGTLRQRAGAVLEESADAARSTRQAETRGALGAERVQTPSPQRLAETRARSVNRQFEEIADDPITLTDDVREFLEDPDFINSLPRNTPLADGSGTAASLRRKIAAALKGEETLTVRDIENVRQLTNVPDFAQETRAILRTQSPEADAALTEFGRRGDVIQGREGNLLRTGRITRQGGREASLEELADQARSGTPEQRRQAVSTLVGARAQGRAELIRRAGESPEQAERVLTELASSENLRANIQTLFGRNAAQRLLRQGEVGDRAARGVEAARPRGDTLGREVTDTQNAAFQAAALLSNRFGAGFVSNFARNLQVSLRVPPAAAQRVAELVSDPTRSREAAALLRRLRVRDQQVADAVARVSAGFAVDEATGPGVTSGAIGVGAGLGRAAARSVGGLFQGEDNVSGR